MFSKNEQIVSRELLETPQAVPEFIIEKGQQMSAQELRHEALLMEWQEKITACRSNGIAVTQWCKEQGITAKAYYR